MNAFGPELVPFVLPPMWILISLTLSHLGGWSELAQHYKDAQDAGPVTKAFFMRSGKVGIVSYSSCLVIRTHESGMSVSVLFPFRIGHPPLFIPWSEVESVEVNRGLLLSHLDVTIGRPRVGRMRLPASIHEYMPASVTARRIAVRA